MSARSLDATLTRIAKWAYPDAPKGEIARQIMQAAEANADQLNTIWRLPEMLGKVARRDRAIRAHFLALSFDLQKEVIGRAWADLLSREDSADSTSTRWLDSEKYSDNPEGGIFEWCGWGLMAQAIDTALHATMRNRNRLEDLDGDEDRFPAGSGKEGYGTDAGRAEKAVEHALERKDVLTANEQALILEAMRPLLDGIRECGTPLDENTGPVLALLAAGNSERARKIVLSNSAIERLTGIPRREVGAILEELRRHTTLAEFLCEPPPIEDSLRARTAPATGSDRDERMPSSIDRELDKMLRPRRTRRRPPERRTGAERKQGNVTNG